jgi:hypothetical protein
VDPPTPKSRERGYTLHRTAGGGGGGDDSDPSDGRDRRGVDRGRDKHRSADRRREGGGRRRDDSPTAARRWNPYERKRSQILADKEAIESRLKTREELGASVAEVDDLVADLEGLKRDAEAMAVSLDGERAERHEDDRRKTRGTDGRLFHQGINSFIREGKHRARALRPKPAGTSRSKLEKIKLPQFSGKCEEWGDFKRVFEELIGPENYAPILYLTQLRSRLPTEALARVEGVTAVDDAWDRLDKRYGDVQLTVITIQRRLAEMALTKTAPHDKLEQMCQELERATTALRSVGRLGVLADDYRLVSTLLRKLPPTYQDRWHLFVTRPALKTAAYTRWDVFQIWIGREREAATSARLMEMESGSSKRTASPQRKSPSRGPRPKCGSSGHGAKSCPAGAAVVLETHALRGRLKTLSRAEGLAKEDRARMGSCPLCGEEHTWARTFPFGVLHWPSQRLSGCKTWVALTPAERARILESFDGCPQCSAYTHTVGECYQKKKRGSNIPCKEKVDGKNCGGDHHKLLHGSESAYCRTAAVRAIAASDEEGHQGGGPQLLEMFECPAQAPSGREATALVFTDGGSTLSLIRHEFANRLGLEGTYVEYYLRVVGHDYARKESKMYTFNLVD